jgi:hypothetical protein
VGRLGVLGRCLARGREEKRGEEAAHLGMRGRIHWALARAGWREGAGLEGFWARVACLRGFRVARQASGAVLGRYEASSSLSHLTRRTGT